MRFTQENCSLNLGHARVDAQTAEASKYNPAPANAGTPPQDAVSGRQNVIRERTEQSAIRQKNDGIGNSAATHGGTAEASTPNPPKTSKAGRVAAQTAEASVYHPAPSNANLPPQDAVSGRQNVIRERTDAVREKPSLERAETVREKPSPERMQTVKEKPSPRAFQNIGEDVPKPAQENRTPVKTREATVRRETLTGTGELPCPTVQEKRKTIRERTGSMTGGVPETLPKGEELRPQAKPAPAKPGADTQQLIPIQERIPEKRIPVKTKETYVLRQTPVVPENMSRTAEPGGAVAIRERTGIGQVSIKTREASIQRRTPSADMTEPQTSDTASKEVLKEAPKELRKTVRTREGLIQSPEQSAEAVSFQPDTLDGKLPAHGQDSHVVKASAPQTGTTPPARKTALSAGTDEPVPDIKTRSAYARKEAALPCEQPNRTVEQGRRKFVQEQKRKADQKHAAERRPKIREAQFPGEETEAASEEAKSLAIDHAQQARSVRTKEAWLRQQGMDGPKERPGFHPQSGKEPAHQTVGRSFASLTDGTSGGEVLPVMKGKGGRELRPSLPGKNAPDVEGNARAMPARFIRQKGRETVKTVENVTGKAVREAAAGRGQVIRAARPVIIKEAGKATGKTVKTAERAANKAVRTAGTASAQAERTAKQAAQAAAKAKTVREASVRAAAGGAKAVKRTAREAARAVVTAAKAAAASLQSLIAGLSAGGGVVLVVLVVICLIGLLVATPFGLFLSGQTGVGDDNIQAAVSRLTGEYNARLQEIQTDVSYDELDIAPDIVSAMTGNWKNVLAVYAVRVTTDEFSATEVVTMTDEKMEILRETFWDMNAIHYWTTRRTEGSGEDAVTIITLHIAPDTKNADDMAEEYGFNERQKGLLEELLSPEYDELFDALLGGSHTLVPGDLYDVLIPGDVSETRRQVIATGSQLLGRVHYFWGGKSLVIGWDSRWGTPTRVWAAGSPSTGTVRPYGLDCSGFVDWVFYNVSGGTYVIGHGGGASMQHSYCTLNP